MTEPLIATCDRCAAVSTAENPHDSCELCTETLCAMCLANRWCTKSLNNIHKPAIFGMPTMICPKCHMEMADFDGFGVLAHVAPMPGACGYCSHPSRDGNAQGQMICGICQAIVPSSSAASCAPSGSRRPGSRGLRDTDSPQIEHVLGRRLRADELARVDSLANLTQPQRAVARELAKKQLVLCAHYLRALAPVSVADANRFMDDLLTTPSPEQSPRTTYMARVMDSAASLGDLVNLVGDTESAYVVVALFTDRVRVVYCGSERWYVPKWLPADQITFPATENKHSRRARRWLDKAGYDPDGWRRITCGRYGSEQRITVDHVAMHEATSK